MQQHNRIFIMRHGESLANIEQIIVSDPAVGTLHYGLTAAGEQQVRSAAAAFPGDTGTIIYASDFLRARETAAILQQAWHTEEVRFHAALRERFFGVFDGRPDVNYHSVWKQDEEDTDYNETGVEPPEAVAGRLNTLIREIDTTFTGRNIVLVSHGDCLQILQAVRSGLAPRQHRRLPHLEVAEIREL